MTAGSYDFRLVALSSSGLRFCRPSLTAATPLKPWRWHQRSSVIVCCLNEAWQE